VVKNKRRHYNANVCFNVGEIKQADLGGEIKRPIEHKRFA